METSKEIDVSNDMLLLESLLNFDSTFDSYQDLQNRYSSLHETYIKEIENSKKVKKSLKKCLKFYSKLSKKFQAQQKIIETLEKNIQEKISSLEESYKNQEKMKGLIDIYKRERSLYSGESNFDLKRDKEMLLEICCQLISESVKTNNIRSLTNLILRKFKKDLNNEKLNLLKGKQINIKKEKCKIKELSCDDIAGANSLNMLIGNNFNQACENKKLSCKDESEKILIESKEFQNNIEIFDEKLSATNINNCTEMISMKSFDELNQEIKKTDENNPKPPENYVISPEKNERKAIDDKIENFKIKTCKTEKIPGSLPCIEDNIQVISDFSDIETGTEENSDSETSPLKNHKITENIAAKINNVKFKDVPDVISENSNHNEICVVPKENNRCELNPLSNSLIENKKSKLTEFQNSNDTQSTEQSNVALLSVCTHKNSFAQQGVFPADFMEDKVSAGRPNANSNVDSRMDFNKKSNESEFGINENYKKSLNVYSETKDFSETKETDESNNECITRNQNSPQKHFTGSGVIVSEMQTLPVFSQSIFDVPDTQVECAKQICNRDLNPEAKKTEKQVVPPESLAQNKDSLNSSLFNHSSNLEISKVISEISTNCLSNKENIDIFESEKTNFESNGIVFDSLGKSIELELSFEKKSEEVALEYSDLCDEERSKIFSEMTNVRLLSPIRDVSEKKIGAPATWQSKNDKHASNKSFTKSADFKFLETDHNFYLEKKRDNIPCDTNKSKKFKLDETIGKNDEKESTCGLLDSIMSAMSIQNKEFKSNAFQKGNLINESPVESHKNCEMQYPKERNKSNLDLLKKNVVQKMEVKSDTNSDIRSFNIFQTTKKNKDKASEKLLEESIQKFIASSNSTKEEADKNVKECISVLVCHADEIIARVIVGMVFQNINEKVENHERPVPPLTNTQYRLIILLSVFKSQDPARENVLSIIMEKILQKLFPDKFHWPDDSVEMACRFYTALCKNRNDIQTCWKFCLQAMTEMKQRSCLAVFTALKTWPDILHHATTLKGNVLALTVVNIFLHMPKKPRNLNQQNKLLALKHLLMAFYGFEVNETFESYASKVLESFLNNEAATEKSLVLIAKCRDADWTRKYVLSKLFSALTQWLQCEITEEMGHKILGVLKQLIPDFGTNFKNRTTEAQEIILCLSKILTSRQMTHESEEKIIEILLEMKQYQSVRQLIREWVPKKPINDNLRNEIINVSAKNILQELKFNRRKHPFDKRNFEGGKRRDKKLKGKSKNKKKKMKKSKKSNGVKAKGEVITSGIVN